jgi:hypothetical protein
MYRVMCWCRVTWNYAIQTTEQLVDRRGNTMFTLQQLYRCTFHVPEKLCSNTYIHFYVYMYVVDNMGISHRIAVYSHSYRGTQQQVYRQRTGQHYILHNNYDIIRMCTCTLLVHACVGETLAPGKTDAISRARDQSNSSPPLFRHRDCCSTVLYMVF